MENDNVIDYNSIGADLFSLQLCHVHRSLNDNAAKQRGINSTNSERIP